MLANWVRQLVTSADASEIILGGNISGYVPVSTMYIDGDVIYYTIEDGFNRENGVGVYVSTTNKITRTTVLEKVTAGVYEEFPASPLTLTGSAIIGVTPTVQGLTTNKAIWKDQHADITFNGNTGYLTPDVTTFVGGIQAYTFLPSTTESLGFRLAVGHDAVVGVGAKPHIRWSPTDTDTGTVRWGLEYVVANRSGTFGDLTTLYFEQAGSGTANTYSLIEHPSLTIPLNDFNALIIGRVFRDSAHANDTYTGNALLHSVGIHYQSDRLGTPTRNTPFTTWS